MPPSEALCRVALSICSGLHTPLAAEVIENIRQRKWKDLAQMRVHPSSYVSKEMYFSDAVAVSLLRNLPMPTGIQTDNVAKATWRACEILCKGTNMRMSAISHSIEYPLAADLDDQFLQAQITLVKCVRKWVSRLLGPAPKFIYGRPSKKATYELRFANSSLINKFAKNPAHTPNLKWPFATLDWRTTAWGRSLEGGILPDGPLLPRDTSGLPQVSGNRFSTVPKDGTTDRPIACEPTLNAYAQLGVGGVLKKRLRRWGLLATKQTCGFESQSWHRRLAQKASRDGEMVTIDLSSASDTVAYGVVQLLFAKEWVDLFSEYRAPRTDIIEKVKVNRVPIKRRTVFLLEKLSSMGNGFTFEVETALFAAIAAASMELVGLEPRFPHNISVYGDDIIVPVEASKMLLNALTYFGFIPNKNKSFTSGPFRESCGGDFWDGADVRPIFFEKDPKGPIDWISVHNKVARLAKRGIPVGPALQLCREQLPARLRSVYGPDYLGDIVLHDPYGLEEPITKVIWSKKPKEPSGYRVLKVVLPVNPSISRSRWDDETVLVAMLYGCQERVPERSPFVSDEIIGYRTAWISWG